MNPERLKEIINSSRSYNFHTHTLWCDGHDSLEAMTRAAIGAGFSHLGFSPHSPVPIPSPCNMNSADVEAYRVAVRQLQAEYASKIEIFMGMEIDFLKGLYGPSSSFFSDLGLDYAIGSVHFIPRRDGRFVDIDGSFDSFSHKMAEDFGGDIRYVVNTFYEASSEMLARGGFQILGHADKIAMNAGMYEPALEQMGWYQDLISDYLTEVAASGVIVEINTKARADKGRFFPHERYWRRLADAGVALMVNSDAHRADKINASRVEAFELLENV